MDDALPRDLQSECNGAGAHRVLAEGGAPDLGWRRHELGGGGAHVR
jgi:hypothetical protein